MRDPYGAGKPKVTLKRPRRTARSVAPSRALSSPRVVLAPQAKPQLTLGDVAKMSPMEKLRRFGFQRASQLDAQIRLAYTPKNQPRLEKANPVKDRSGLGPEEGPGVPYGMPGYKAHDFGAPKVHVPTKAPSLDDLIFQNAAQAIGPDVLGQAANPRVAALQSVLGGVTGIPSVVDALRSKNYLSAGAQASMFLPFGRIFRGAEEGARVVRAAADTARAAGAGREEVVKAATNAMKQRIFRVNNLEVAIPAAGSRTGRAAERAVDATRGATSRVGLKNEAERAGSEYAVTQSNRMKTLTNAAQTLRKIGKHLDDVQQYTLRILGEGVNPLDRIAMHEGQIADATAHGSMDEAAYHGVHSSLIQQATKKYLDIAPDGTPSLKPNAPAHLHQAWDLLQEVAAQRENLYRDLGLLNDQQIAERIHAPGRVTKGARYIPNTEEIAQRLEASPGRKALKAALAEKLPDDEPAQRAVLQMADAFAMHHADAVVGEPLAVDDFYSRLLDINFHDRIDPSRVPESINYLYQGETPPTPDLPPSINYAMIARNAMRSGHELPKEISDPQALRQAIRNVYELARTGAPYKDWYDRAAEAIKTVADYEGVSAKEMAQLVAIYSQSANPTANMAFAVKAVREFKETGEVKSLGAGGYPQREKAQRVLEGHPWEGRKTNSFYQNILDSIDPSEASGKPVTVDRWVIRMFAPQEHSSGTVPPKLYNGIEHIIQQMADELGWTPKEVQAAAWVTAKSRSLIERYPNRAEQLSWREAGDAYEEGVRRHSAQGTLFQTDPAMLQAGVVQTRMLMESGTAADEAIAKTASMFGLPEDELRQAALGTQGDREMERVLSNREVWRENDPAYQQARNDAKAGEDLEGLPTVGGIKWRSSAEAQQIAEKYMADHGMPYEPPRTYAKVDRERAKRIAEWYDEAQHAPADPETDAAYAAMIQETLDQYKAITDAGYTFEFYPADDPYPGGPREAMMDLRDNKHLYVFPTDQGFGTESETLTHPLLQTVPVDWGKGEITANDLFRAVHDFFGHFKEGVGFRADGEENAWRAHSAMYSPEARRAMTSETRGQNSWVNFGPHGDANRTASQADTVYADQKAVLAPEWVVNDGAGDAPAPPSVLYQGVEDFHDSARNELESYRALARDIRSTLPEKDWPRWVHNIDRERQLPVDMTPAKPRPLEVRALPDETPEELATRQAAVNEDYQQRLKEWNDRHASDTFPEDWLPQRAYSGPYGEGIDMPFAYKGAIQFTSDGAVLHLTDRTDVSTFVHEMAHFVRRYVVNDEMTGYGTLAKEVGLKITNEAERSAARRAHRPLPRPVWSEWDTQAEEKFARMFESWIRTGRAPGSFSQPISVLSRRLRDIYEHSDLPDVPPDIARFFERLVTSREPRGGRLVGAEDFHAGVAYIPYVRGIPQSRNALTDSTAAYFRRAQAALFGRNDRAALGAGPRDVRLRKAFKGNLLLQGNFKINVTDASAESLMVAARLSAARQARADLIKAATELPTHSNDIALKVDPNKDAPQELGAFFDKLRDLDDEGKLDFKALEGIDLNLSEALRDALMPTTIDGVPIEKAAARAIESSQPIDNIVWIPRDFIDKTMLRGTAGSNKAHLDGLNKVARTAVMGAGMSFDAVNDIAKAVLLYLNPAYAPVNLAGNLVMNMMHQGPFMLINLWRSAFLHRDLNVRERVLLDSLMGHGVITSLITQGKIHPAALAHNTLGRALNLLVDFLPRRAAFLHEAHKLGFDTPEKLRMLLDDRDHSDEMLRIRDYIARRANDAIVDYDRMGPLDKAILNRVIFFYPWLKGATRYTNRFIVEHPYQAMALAVMADHAYNTANQEIGERPDFLKETFPISTEALGARVPILGLDLGSLADVVGEHRWTDSEGRPMTINVRQAFTMTSPLELIQSGVSFASGDPSGAGDLVQNLTPVPYAAGVALYGKDPFKRRDVPQGARTFYEQLFGAPPIKTDIERITMSDKEREQRNEKALYPRSKGQEEAHVFGGGLTPTPVNTVTAAGLAAETSGDSYKQQVVKLREEAKQYGMQPPSAAVLDDLKWRTKLSKAEKRNSPYTDKLQAAAKVYADRTGDKSIFGDIKGVSSEAMARDFYYMIRDQLFARYNRWYEELSTRKQVKGG